MLVTFDLCHLRGYSEISLAPLGRQDIHFHTWILCVQMSKPPGWELLGYI